MGILHEFSSCVDRLYIPKVESCESNTGPTLSLDKKSPFYSKLISNLSLDSTNVELCAIREKLTLFSAFKRTAKLASLVALSVLSLFIIPLCSEAFRTTFTMTLKGYKIVALIVDSPKTRQNKQPQPIQDANVHFNAEETTKPSVPSATFANSTQQQNEKSGSPLAEDIFANPDEKSREGTPIGSSNTLVFFTNEIPEVDTKPAFVDISNNSTHAPVNQTDNSEGLLEDEMAESGRTPPHRWMQISPLLEQKEFSIEANQVEDFLGGGMAINGRTPRPRFLQNQENVSCNEHVGLSRNPGTSRCCVLSPIPERDTPLTEPDSISPSSASCQMSHMKDRIAFAQEEIDSYINTEVVAEKSAMIKESSNGAGTLLSTAAKATAVSIASTSVGLIKSIPSVVASGFELFSNARQAWRENSERSERARLERLSKRREWVTHFIKAIPDELLYVSYHLLNANSSIAFLHDTEFNVDDNAMLSKIRGSGISKQYEFVDKTIDLVVEKDTSTGITSFIKEAYTAVVSSISDSKELCYKILGEAVLNPSSDFYWVIPKILEWSEGSRAAILDNKVFKFHSDVCITYLNYLGVNEGNALTEESIIEVGKKCFEILVILKTATKYIAKDKADGVRLFVKMPPVPVNYLNNTEIKRFLPYSKDIFKTIVELKGVATGGSVEDNIVRLMKLLEIKR